MKLIRPLVLSILAAAMIAPAAISAAQSWRQHPREGMYISIGPTSRRWYHGGHWVIQHHRRWHGAWTWR